ncbi:glycoside hydrolase family 2 TIM barrel-domain containing protein [Chitinophaga sp. MM2321]|uniref:glycoside hydrolase family 2 TIM barrel-domain containing protein n=1 Tax=Chitinophaga sp. MM2321 TaxID=3137178 RepID=UPI0032D576F9
MKRIARHYYITTLLCFFFIPVIAQSVSSGSRPFNSEWRFFLGDATGAEKPGFDDRNWRSLDIPHDWSIEDLPNQSDHNVIGPFYRKSVGATSTGYTVGGHGWYRKKFVLPEADHGKLVSVLFDGIYMQSDLWINGHYLGHHAYGYTPIHYDLSPYLNPAGQPNILAVQVKNEGRNSRWYTGSGIYRNAWLNVTDPVHIPQWGVFVTTPKVTEKEAVVSITASVTNTLQQAVASTMLITIVDANGKQVAKVRAGSNIKSNETVAIQRAIRIPKPKLWSPDSPTQYSAIVSLYRNEKLTGQTTTRFGIRSIHFDAAQGFLLNGKRLLLKGGSVHHDNGIIGSAAINRAEIRKAQLLKSNGFNAVRTSHNPPSEAFLDACDSIGLLVIDEAFDMWQRQKNAQDYHLYFNDYWQKDLRSIILRDRNHPSVLLWSIGNEINERADPTGLALTKQLRDEVRKLDTTRPVTAGICDFSDFPKGQKHWDETAPAFEILDVAGYNYQLATYVSDHDKYPSRVIVGTESFPVQRFENWQAVEKYPWITGDFVWTAMDYIGETAIGHTVMDNEKDGGALEWPWFNGNCGDIDLIGGKKPQAYYRDVIWNRSKIAMAVHAPIPKGLTEVVSKWGWPDERQSWTWPGQEGAPMDVTVYSRYPTVRLELNGNIIAEKSCSPETSLTARFKVPYQPGVLKVTGIENGIRKDSSILQTSGKPSRIRLTADRQIIQADRNDLAYIRADIVDENGVIITEPVTLHFTVEGDAELMATGNADPKDMRSFTQPTCTTYRGSCLIILRPKGKTGTAKLKVVAENIPDSEIRIELAENAQ